MTHCELPCICSVEPPEPTKLSASTGRRSGWTDLITAFPVMLQGTRSAYRPEKLLRLYEYEASSECPRGAQTRPPRASARQTSLTAFAAKVRETLSMLDLDYVCLPCPLEDPLSETLAREGAGGLMLASKAAAGASRSCSTPTHWRSCAPTTSCRTSGRPTVRSAENST